MIVCNVFKMEKSSVPNSANKHVIGYCGTFGKRENAEIVRSNEEKKMRDFHDEINKKLFKRDPEKLPGFEKTQREKYTIEIQEYEVL